MRDVLGAICPAKLVLMTRTMGRASVGGQARRRLNSMLCLRALSPELETMKIVAIDEVPLIRGLEHRGGTFHSQTTVEGTPGTAGNFKFSLSRLGTDYS